MDDDTRPTEPAASGTGDDAPRFLPHGMFAGMPLSDSPNYVPSRNEAKAEQAPTDDEKKERKK